jgi:hypothetical protein
MATTKENEMTSRTILTEAGLDPKLIDKMEASKAACAKPCPTCGAGAGRWCLDLNRVGEIKNRTIHPARR